MSIFKAEQTISLQGGLRNVFTLISVHLRYDEGGLLSNSTFLYFEEHGFWAWALVFSSNFEIGSRKVHGGLGYPWT